MSFETEIDGDYAVLDGVEAVTLVSKTSTGETVQAVSGALRMALDVSELVDVGSLGIEQQATVWNLPVVNCGGLVPQGGDALTDSAGGVWTVHRVEQRTRNSRYRCVCIQQR